PRQSLSSLILASISREGEASPFPSVEPLVLFFMMVVAFFMAVVARPSLESRSPDGAQAKSGAVGCIRETQIALRSIRATLASSQSLVSFIPGLTYASPSDTQGRRRMP